MYLYAVMGLLCCNEWGASSSVIHPPSKTIKELLAPHSSPLHYFSVLLSYKHWGWSEVGWAVCVCVSPCARTHVRQRGWMGWSGIYNSREPQRTAKETFAIQMFEIKGLFSGLQQGFFAHVNPFYYKSGLRCCWPFFMMSCEVAIKAGGIMMW